MVLLGMALPLSATHLPVKIYTVADGLARDAVGCIVPDSRGFLWLCTDEGLSRFDSYQFLNYGLEQGLAHRSVTAFLETHQGIYLAATGYGVSRLDPAAPRSSPRKFVSLPVNGGKGPFGAYALFEDRAGTVWSATSNGLYRIDHPGGPDAALHFVDLGLQPGETPAASVAEDRYGGLWVSTGSGLCRRWPDGRVERYTGPANGLPARTASSLLVDGEGRLWVGTLDGLWRMRVEPRGQAPHIERAYGTRDGLGSARIHSLFQSASGTIWVGTASSLSELVVSGGGREWFRSYSAEQGLSGRAVMSLNEDRAGNLWAGVDHGLARIARNGFATYTAAEGLGDLAISSLFEDAGGNLFAISNQTSSIVIHRFDGSRFHAIRPQYPANIRYFGWATNQSALRDRHGEWWIATGEGLVRFPRTTTVEELAHTPPKAVYTKRNGLPEDEIFRVFEDSRGGIWVTTYSFAAGPSRWDRATGVFRRFSKEECPGLATAFAEDRAGNLWIGFSNDVLTRKPTGLIRYRGGQMERFTNADGVPAGWIRALHVDRAGRLWIASGDGGLGRLDDAAAERPRFSAYTTAQGLSSITVRCITEDRWGRIYAGTARGVDRWDPDTNRLVGRP
jgi:ligand-binding sensor domain-containing protein